MTETQPEFFVHQDPVWRDRANFIIHAELPEKDRPKRFEQLWARQLGDDRFEVCCTPFFVFDLALGDVVATAPRHGRKYVVDRVIEPSGRYVFRVWFGQSFYPRDEIAKALKALGSMIEWSSRNLLAVDAADSEHAQLVAHFLMEREKAGHLIYETGRS
jgi:Domain of unknown function (DUF4265)